MQLELPLMLNEPALDDARMSVWRYMTHHARVRAHQHRGIPQEAIELLLEFGAEERARDGVLRYFSKASRERIARTRGEAFVDSMGPLWGCILIEGYDGTIITVGHRIRRIRRRVRWHRVARRSARARRRNR